MNRTETVSITQNSTNDRFKAPAALRLSCQLLSTVAPPLAAQAAAAIFRHPHRKARPAAEEDWLKSATPFRLPTEKHDLAAWSWGSGPTVLLHHGWGGRGAQLGAFVEPLLAAGYRVVTYDALAHGASPGRTASLIEMAACLGAAGSQLGGLYGVIAHSLGGLATALACANGLHLRRAVLISPPSDMLYFTTRFCRSLGFSSEVHERMLGLFEKRLHMSWNDLDGVALAQRQRTPLLIIHDRDDHDVPQDQVQRLHRAWPGSRLKQTVGFGHRAIVRQPSVVAAGVQFLIEERHDET